jgi:hypothetical protein
MIKSTLVPTFLRELASDACRNVLLCGCGGGFDFVHGLMLYPELLRLGKRVTIASYSFGTVEAIGEPAPVVFSSGGATVKLVTASSGADENYAPEVHVCSYLDRVLPGAAPHSIYASNARDFTARTLREFYSKLVSEHDIDTIIMVDGGTDSLMRGDEADIGDPVEDITSIGAVAALETVPRRRLISVGFGVDRFNGVADASSMRAVAELTRAGGFLGSLAVEPGNPAAEFYRAAVEHIYANQRFQSAVTGFVLSAMDGHYGSNEVPPPLRRKFHTPEKLYIWPLMATLFAFDVAAVAERSLLVDWIADAESEVDAYKAISAGRQSLGNELRATEEFPRATEMKGRFGVDFTRLAVTDREAADGRLLEELPGAGEEET